MTFVGAIIFLAVVLTIFTYHSSHYEGSEGHSIARAHSDAQLPNDESTQTEAMTKVEEGEILLLYFIRSVQGESPTSKIDQ